MQKQEQQLELGPVPGAKNTEYYIPGIGTVNWQHHRGSDRMRIDWNGTLAAMKESTVPAYRTLHDQAEQFFTNVAASFNGDMPVILPLMVPNAGRIPAPGLGNLYRIRYKHKDMWCVIPESVVMGKWEHR